MTQLEPDREPIPDDVPEGAGGLTDDPGRAPDGAPPAPTDDPRGTATGGPGTEGSASGSASVTRGEVPPSPDLLVAADDLEAPTGAPAEGDPAELARDDVPPVGSDAPEDTLGAPVEPDPDGPADDPDAVSTPIDDAPRAPGLH